MAINRLRVEWSGNVVTGPGLTTFYATGLTVADMTQSVRDYFAAVADEVPVGVTWSIPQGGDSIDEATGDLIGTWGSGGALQVSSTGGGSYAAGVGLRHTLQTASVVSGRRVRGAFFLVPLTVSNYATDGSISTGTLSTIDAAAQALYTALDTEWVVWSRPNGSRPGSFAEVTGVTTPDKVSWLRSRRT
uniref:Uncharacterized protein n=1 Tax=uncultured prokaryote TaxID=198431 RepID=A0A0H5PWL5_9ZZZZ|nr:hypothetical protein [uncultured prokaryote]